MLTYISVKNFAVVKNVEIDINHGLTVVTGETGAGKSIAIDALSLCLGARADANSVRPGAEKAEIVAYFDVSSVKKATSWLSEHELLQEDNQHECFIRRVISQEGRSKAFVNGSVVTLAQLKQLGQMLISIHGQHAHHQLLKPNFQRELLDNYAGNNKELDALKIAYQALTSERKALNELISEQAQRADRRNLLQYQVQELDEFSIGEHEFSELEIEHKRLSNSQTLLEQAQLSFHKLYEGEDFNALSSIRSSADNLSEMKEHDASLSPIVEMLNEAAIQVEEASQEIRQYCEQLEIDPMRLQQVEQRYSQAMDLARKHHVDPELLFSKHMELDAEFKQLNQDESQIEALQASCKQRQEEYESLAVSLSNKRKKAALKLGKEIQTSIREMNMPHAVLEVDVEFDSTIPVNAFGQDLINIKVATNPGLAADTLEKVVSGGELSRIGLAIQVITSGTDNTPTLIFDEVDTGISGPTAAIVGKLLRKLGAESQVLCVTHLPQVAALGHNQLFVTKLTDTKTSETKILKLTDNERVNEVARLLAGDKLTDSALANARELLKLS
ncbi:DNA repair protein RecN [Glaciecola sp. KUL10]|uniref:DNA repair protein RecN n=1 Tax=Glaciecola sp. (strain KUL10) TaxID=2161813 RepID=UPI000D783BFA|nr:DNA repair protein RecN [Glaciecola sp. KUL10]GBL03410.1 DNA repair protein RecN [Glaciecola sp. KUL10]